MVSLRDDFKIIAKQYHASSLFTITYYLNNQEERK